MLETSHIIPQKSLRIGDYAPVFRARTTMGDISLDQYQGRWLVFFSHPADFTPVCTSEFIAFANAAESFKKLNCALLGLSVDSVYSHIAWVRAIHEAFGTIIPFPIVEDPSMVVAQAYGMLDATSQDSSAIRASYIIDPEGVIRAISWYPMTVGRSVAEILRTLIALQQTTANDALTPEGWQPGDEFLAQPVQAALAADSPATWFCQTWNVT